MAKKRGPYRKQSKKNPLVKLAEWRTFRGWTVEELAERSGLSTGTISGIERGDVGFSEESILALARAIGCTVGELFDVDPNETAGFWQTWSKMTQDERQWASRMIETMPKRGK